MNVGFHYLPGGQDDPGPVMPASTFLDIGPSRGMLSPEKMARIYFKGKPEPAVVAQIARTWHQSGARVQLGNEPNLPIEEFGGGPVDYRAWFFAVKAKIPGVRCYWAGMSPGVDGWPAWYQGAKESGADGVVVHAYGTFAQMRATTEAVLAICPGLPLWLGEVNFEAGQAVDRDLWAVDHLKPFLDWCSGQPRIEAVTYFAWQWSTPDMHLPTPVDANNTKIADVIRTWTPPQEPTVTSIKGIDVSNNQGRIDWFAVGTAVPTIEFAILKASGDEGAGNVFFDSFFPENWVAARAEGLIRGAYHYARPSVVSPAQSVTTFQRAIQAVGGLRSGDLIALDTEDPASPNGTSLHRWTAEWLALAEQVFGVVPFKYSARYYTSTHDLEHADLAKYPTWWASYQATQPAPVTGWGPIRIWQNSAEGAIPGVSGHCDLNVFTGTRAELAALGFTPPAVSWEAPVLAPIYQGASAVPGMADATPEDVADAQSIIRLMDKLKSRHPAA